MSTELMCFFLLFKNGQEFSRGLRAYICDANKIDKTVDIDESQQKLEKVIGFLKILSHFEIEILC